MKRYAGAGVSVYVNSSSSLVSHEEGRRLAHAPRKDPTCTVLYDLFRFLFFPRDTHTHKHMRKFLLEMCGISYHECDGV